jgi:23S rRNA (cytosine1962-C5)-methyltransferase
MLQVYLNRNLRRSVLRGHPWIYREAVVAPPTNGKAQLCQVFDSKREALAWALYDPHCPLSLRVLSLERKPPDAKFFRSRFGDAWSIRRPIASDRTTCYRLFNGEGDLLPGLICDIYGGVAVVQVDGLGPSEFWDRDAIATWLIDEKICQTVVEKFRRDNGGGIRHLRGQPTATVLEVRENGVKFMVDIENGQKTGFFLDQRDNRNYLQAIVRGSSLINLFSYSGGFSVYAGMGGASRIVSLDIAVPAIEFAAKNWALNGLPPHLHTGICADVFEYLNGETEQWDHVIVDPPSMGHSEDGKERMQAKYIELFAAATKRVNRGGQLSLSSCSSHVSFNDFFEIITESLSKASRRGRILRVAGQGPDHPFPHAAQELRYLKFVHLILN